MVSAAFLPGNPPLSALTRVMFLPDAIAGVFSLAEAHTGLDPLQRFSASQHHSRLL